MKNYVNLLFKKVILASFVCAFGLNSIAQEVEEVVVTAEKRSESLHEGFQNVFQLLQPPLQPPALSNSIQKHTQKKLK